MSALETKQQKSFAMSGIILTVKLIFYALCTVFHTVQLHRQEVKYVHTSNDIITHGSHVLPFLSGDHIYTSGVLTC